MNISNFNIDSVFFKCSICSYPLSFKPVYHNSSLGNVCGRCSELIMERYSEKTFERQILYEVIAENFIFPCAFKGQGCLAELNMEGAFMHEATCLFKVTTVLCPLFHEKFYEWCTWIGEYEELSEHIRNKHKHFFTDTLAFTLTPDFGTKILFCNFNSNLIMIVFDKKSENNSYTCWIMSDMYFKECLEHNFEICFSAGDGQEVIFEGAKIEYISPSTRISPEYNLAIPVCSVNHLFEKNEKLTVLISIKHKGNLELNLHETLEIIKSQNIPSEVAELKTETLRELECPICTDLMGPPIYMCIEGHNMCVTCRSKILECPVCRGKILGGRNFTLEKLCSIVIGPCLYRKDGCSYIGTIAKCKMHEAFCYLAVRSCVINICPWNGRTLELPEHLETEHTFRDISESYPHKIGQKSEEHIFQYDDKIFLMKVCSAEKKTLHYSIYCIGGKYLEYNYELELIDPFVATNKIVLRDACQPVGYNFNKNSFELLSIPINMLTWLIKDNNEINIKLNIHCTS